MPHNLSHIKEMIDRCQWQWAKTYENCPHEYIVRGKCELTDEEFLAFVDAQRCMGTPEQWGKYNFPYLYINGYKYWTMGSSYEETKIINRQKVFGEFDQLSNPTLPHYSSVDSQYIVNRVMLLVRDNEVFEAACGDGQFVKESNISPNKYHGVDPCKKAIANFKNNLPEFANRIRCQSFEEAINAWKGKEAVVVATFGAASYIMKPYLQILATHNRHYFLMFYKEDFCPESFKEMHHFHYSHQELEEIFPKARIYAFKKYLCVEA